MALNLRIPSLFDLRKKIPATISRKAKLLYQQGSEEHLGTGGDNFYAEFRVVEAITSLKRKIVQMTNNSYFE